MSICILNCTLNTVREANTACIYTSGHRGCHTNMMFKPSGHHLRSSVPHLHHHSPKKTQNKTKSVLEKQFASPWCITRSREQFAREQTDSAVGWCWWLGAYTCSRAVSAPRESVATLPSRRRRKNTLCRSSWGSPNICGRACCLVLRLCGAGPLLSSLLLDHYTHQMLPLWSFLLLCGSLLNCFPPRPEYTDGDERFWWASHCCIVLWHIIKYGDHF